MAFYVLGEARSKPAIPILASQLTRPYPLVRGYAARALDHAFGAPVAIDIDGDDAVIDAAARAWLAVLKNGWVGAIRASRRRQFRSGCCS